jgi:hypothetical protein
MSWRIVIAAVAAIVPVSVAFAQNMPSHDDICVPPIKYGKPDLTAEKIVSKEKLAKAILKSNDDALKLYVDVSERPSKPKYAPQWRRIFTDPDFCASDTACLGPPLKPIGPNPKPDNSAALQTLMDLQNALTSAIQINTAAGKFYRTDYPGDMNPDYLLGENEQKQIICTATDLPAPTKPMVLNVPERLRLRANSDDLNIDAKKQKQEFKSVNPAAINFTRDGVEKTNTTKLQAALGYAYSNDFDVPGFRSFHAEMIPYISAIQSTTKADGMAATYSDTNSVAVGSLFSSRTTVDGMVGVAHVVSAKPQYLWNTKDKSEIASMTFVYQPWTQRLFDIAGVPIKINSAFPVGTFVGGGPTWVRLLFDLRNDVGEYTKRGIDPVTALTHNSFDRAGSKFGFSVTTNENGPHVVLTVTETLLYGFAGSIRRLDYFDSSLTFYFDSTTNFGFTLAYTKGTNEDTAERAQTFMAGLSAKF